MWNISPGVRSTREPLVSLPGNLCSDCMAKVVVVGRGMEEGEGRKGKREDGELAAQKEETAAKTKELEAKERELAEVQRELAGKDATIQMHETTIVTLRSRTTMVSDHNSSLE